MMVSKLTKLEEIEWLVANRSRNQQSALAIYRLIEKHKKKLNRRRRHRAYLQMLIGINFSLWRAVFLANIKQTKGAMLEDAEKFISELIESNTITFQTDRTSKEWSFRYYVQNARDRLKIMHTSFSHKRKSFPLPSQSVGLTPHEWWETHQTALEAATQMLDEILSI